MIFYSRMMIRFQERYAILIINPLKLYPLPKIILVDFRESHMKLYIFEFLYEIFIIVSNYHTLHAKLCFM